MKARLEKQPDLWCLINVKYQTYYTKGMKVGRGRWEMGDGRWEMGDGRWEVEGGRSELGFRS
jgi:hypothetical protein